MKTPQRQPCSRQQSRSFVKPRGGISKPAQRKGPSDLHKQLLQSMLDESNSRLTQQQQQQQQQQQYEDPPYFDTEMQDWWAVGNPDCYQQSNETLMQALGTRFEAVSPEHSERWRHVAVLVAAAADVATAAAVDLPVDAASSPESSSYSNSSSRRTAGAQQAEHSSKPVSGNEAPIASRTRSRTAGTPTAAAAAAAEEGADSAAVKPRRKISTKGAAKPRSRRSSAGAASLRHKRRSKAAAATGHAAAAAAVPADPLAEQEQVGEVLKSLTYTMLTDNMRSILAASIVCDPYRAQQKLKVAVHRALVQGRDAVLREDDSSANKHFAYAYQMRCFCDYIWAHYVPQKYKKRQAKDSATRHALFVQLSRSFSKYATGKVPQEERAEVLKMIEKLF